MKTKKFANTKRNKRSFSETTLPVKTEQKPQNLTESKKSFKKIKIENAENGSPVSANKTRTLKKADKQKNKSMKAKQQNKGSNNKSSINETKIATIQVKDENLSKTKQKKLEFIKKRQLKREAQRALRKVTGRYFLAELGVEKIKDKIAEIKSRKELSKTAKRKLGILQKRLRMKESNNLEKSNTTEKKSNKKDNHQAGTFVRVNQKANVKVKLEVKKEHATKVKNEPEEHNQDDSDMQDDNDEEEIENQSDIKKEEEEEKENEGEEEEEEDMNIAEEQSDDESDEDEEDEESDDEEATILEVKKEKKKQIIRSPNSRKTLRKSEKRKQK